jgi:hypothetical protein
MRMNISLLRMTPFLLVSASCLTFISCTHVKTEEAHWRTLLNANHTNGWRMVGPGEFKWENGELVTYGGMGLFYYDREKFGNCKIRVVFKLTAEDDNSGVFIRIAQPPKDPWEAVHNGYEVQIANKGDEWHRTGTLYSFTKAKNMVDSPVGEWSTMIITLDGKRTITHINGVLVSDFTEGDPVPEKKIWYEPERRPRMDSGYIGLQNHGGEAHVHFKEVSVGPLK